MLLLNFCGKIICGIENSSVRWKEKHAASKFKRLNKYALEVAKVSGYIVRVKEKY
jgi:hypothetical protein